MEIKIDHIDGGKGFNFGRVSEDYGKYRDIYPDEMFEKLHFFGVGRIGENTLDLGTGTGVLPRHMYRFGGNFAAVDISEEMIKTAIALSGDKNITYGVAPAHHTGFKADTFHAVTAVQCSEYFDYGRVLPEILRVLRPGGKYCTVNMEWLPCEDSLHKETEELLLKYNPAWTGGGYSGYSYKQPEWISGNFEIETIHSYKPVVEISPEAWRGRIRASRAVGAALPEEEALRFDKEYAQLLQKYVADNRLMIKHQINIEVYRKAERAAK